MPKLFQIVLFLTVVSFGCSKQSRIKSIEVKEVKNPVVSLNGTWKFSMTPPEEFWKTDTDFKNWSDILVPGECQMQGFAIKHDQSYAYKHDFLIPEFKEVKSS
ncbi:unnamed protein product [marine sediment metagenome]|uniref:Beta-galactosidase n=1 Tax=marine sediment metagenome TaxID=412755 RepID=X1TDJ9_9ZZZZ